MSGDALATVDTGVNNRRTENDVGRFAIFVLFLLLLFVFLCFLPDLALVLVLALIVLHVLSERPNVQIIDVGNSYRSGDRDRSAGKHTDCCTDADAGGPSKGA